MKNSQMKINSNLMRIYHWPQETSNKLGVWAYIQNIKVRIAFRNIFKKKTKKILVDLRPKNFKLIISD